MWRLSLLFVVIGAVLLANWASNFISIWSCLTQSCCGINCNRPKITVLFQTDEICALVAYSHIKDTLCLPDEILMRFRWVCCVDLCSLSFLHSPGLHSSHIFCFNILQSHSSSCSYCCTWIKQHWISTPNAALRSQYGVTTPDYRFLSRQRHIKTTQKPTKIIFQKCPESVNSRMLTLIHDRALLSSGAHDEEYEERGKRLGLCVCVCLCGHAKVERLILGPQHPWRPAVCSHIWALNTGSGAEESGPSWSCSGAWGEKPPERVKQMLSARLIITQFTPPLSSHSHLRYLKLSELHLNICSPQQDGCVSVKLLIKGVVHFF